MAVAGDPMTRAIAVSTTAHLPPLGVPVTDPTGIYSRDGTSVTEQVEVEVDALEGGRAVIYASGLAAVFSALMHYRPARILGLVGYHGTRHTMGIYARTSGCVFVDLDVSPNVEMQRGDLVWLESPRNSRGDVQDISWWSSKAHGVGAHVIVDATFAPPPLLKAVDHGCDMVMQSLTKFYGGHSDLLGGALIVRSAEQQHCVSVATPAISLCSSRRIAQFWATLWDRWNRGWSCVASGNTQTF
jgi:cystathionine beta-lyase/cystathionine gamma-synthase